MRYPNAYKGVSRIYLAELLAILAAVLAIVAVIFGFAGIGAAATGHEGAGGGLAIGGGLFVVFTGILMIFSFFINIIGVSNASNDEPAFKSALIAIIVGIVASIISSIFASNEVVYYLAMIVSKVCEIATFFFCIGGIRNLADALGNSDVADRANTVLKLVLGVYIVSIILTIITGFVALPGLLTGIISVVSSLCMIVAYFMYLSLLRRAKDMLSR